MAPLSKTSKFFWQQEPADGDAEFQGIRAEMFAEDTSIAGFFQPFLVSEAIFDVMGKHAVNAASSLKHADDDVWRVVQGVVGQNSWKKDLATDLQPEALPAATAAVYKLPVQGKGLKDLVEALHEAG